MSNPVERTHRITPDLFLSYAREDLAEARRLAEQIESRGYTVAMDVNDVAPGEDWQARLDQLLRGAAKFLFLATPASVVSPACAHELDLARQEGKAILTVVLGTTSRDALPEPLQSLHYNRFPQEGDWTAGLSALVGAIGSDLDWERRKASYLARATDQGLLYGRAEVQQAESWALARPANAAPVPDTVAEMIKRSRARLASLARVAVLGFAALSLVIAGLAVQAYQRSRLAETRNGVLMATEAERLAGELRTDAALLVLLQAAELVAGTGAGSVEVKRIEAAAARILDRAERERRYEIPGDSQLFEHANTLYYVSPTETGLWWLDPDAGPRRVADWPGRLIGSAEQYGEGSLPVVLALQTDSTVTVAETDPETGQRGRELTFEAAEIVPETAWANIGPDGRGIVSGETGETSTDGTILTKSWAFDLTAGRVTVVPPDLPAYLVLYVDDSGRSLLGEMWNAEAIWDFNFDQLALEEYGFDELRYNDCLRKGGLAGDAVMQMATNMAAIAETAEDLIEATNEELALLNVEKATCVFSQKHASFSSYQSTSAGGLITSSLWGRDDWFGPTYPLWMTETSGWQTKPSLFSSGLSTTLAIADLSDVVVYRITGTEQDYTDDEMRVSFAHNVEIAIAVDPNRIIAVEGFAWNEPGPRRRVTVLSLEPFASNRFDAEEVSVADPAWPDLCLSDDAANFALDVTWLARDRIEVSPNRPPDNILTLPPDLADFVHGDKTADTVGLPTDTLALCITFTPDGKALMFESAAGTSVHQTTDWAHITNLPKLRANAPLALREGYREALVSEDRRTIERLWQAADGTWQRAPVLFTPYAVKGLFLPPDEDILIVIYDRGSGTTEARAISLADYRELKSFGSTYKFITPEWMADGSVRLPELGAAFRQMPVKEAMDRLKAALSADCRPPRTDWQSSPCWPLELK